MQKQRKLIFGTFLAIMIGGAFYFTACRKQVIEPKLPKQSYFEAKVDGIACEWEIDYSHIYQNISMHEYNPNEISQVSVKGSFGYLNINISNGFAEPYTYIQDTTHYIPNDSCWVSFYPTMEVDPDPYCDYGMFGNNKQHGYRSYFALNYLSHYGHYPALPVVPSFHIEINNEDVIEGSFDASLLNMCYADSTPLGIITITEAKFKFYRKDFENN